MMMVINGKHRQICLPKSIGSQLSLDLVDAKTVEYDSHNFPQTIQ